MKKNFFSSNLKYLRLKYKLEQKDISGLLKLKSPTSVTNWEKGNNMARSSHLNDLANYFCVNIDDLLNTDLSLQDSKTTNVIKFTEMNFVSIPILREITFKTPILADENILGYRYHLKDSLPSGEMFYLQAKGEAMEPKIPKGAYVLIKKQDEVRNGEIAAVLVKWDTEVILRRLYRQTDTISLVAEEPHYPPYIIDVNNPARILGKAIEVSFNL